MTHLSCLVLALSPGPDQFFDMEPMSTSTSSSSRTSWTSESNLPERGKPGTTLSTQPTTTRRGEILRAFWVWNGATAISGTCHFAVMLVPTPRTLVWPTYPSGAGLIQNYLWTVGRESAVGGLHGRQEPLRARRLDVVMWLVPPFRLDERCFFTFARQLTQTLLNSMTTHRQQGWTSWWWVIP